VSADLSALCRSCGLCCDGTLFTFVRLDAAEARQARSNGLTIVHRDDGSDALPQPCSALRGRDCSAYESRPGPCLRYECSLLDALRGGETSLEEAQVVVTEAHRLVAEKAPIRGYVERHFLGRFVSPTRTVR
jgi:uncharacterized protein